MSLKLTPAQLRVLRYLGAPGIDQRRGRECWLRRAVPARKLRQLGLAEPVASGLITGIYRITPAGLEYLAKLENEK